MEQWNLFIRVFHCRLYTVYKIFKYLKKNPWPIRFEYSTMLLCLLTKIYLEIASSSLTLIAALTHKEVRAKERRDEVKRLWTADRFQGDMQVAGRV